MHIVGYRLYQYIHAAHANFYAAYHKVSAGIEPIAIPPISRKMNFLQMRGYMESRHLPYTFMNSECIVQTSLCVKPSCAGLQKPVDDNIS